MFNLFSIGQKSICKFEWINRVMQFRDEWRWFIHRSVRTERSGTRHKFTSICNTCIDDTIFIACYSNNNKNWEINFTRSYKKNDKHTQNKSTHSQLYTHTKYVLNATKHFRLEKRWREENNAIQHIPFYNNFASHHFYLLHFHWFFFSKKKIEISKKITLQSTAYILPNISWFSIDEISKKNLKVIIFYRFNLILVKFTVE